MKRFRCSLTVVIICIALSACDQASMMKRMISPEDEADAKHYIELLRQNNLDQIEKDLDPSIKSLGIRETLAKMAGFIPSTSPESVKLVGSQVFQGPGYRRANITFEYRFPGKWLLINVATEKKSSIPTIVGRSR